MGRANGTNNNNNNNNNIGKTLLLSWCVRYFSLIWLFFVCLEYRFNICIDSTFFSSKRCPALIMKTRTSLSMDSNNLVEFAYAAPFRLLCLVVFVSLSLSLFNMYMPVLSLVSTFLSLSHKHIPHTYKLTLSHSFAVFPSVCAFLPYVRRSCCCCCYFFFNH